ncbi:MAG: c-type cytochrome [Verrucomicrobia bacterium]|nr:c-type cytochrome [Verrucomicrobiota bacterium]
MNHFRTSVVWSFLLATNLFCDAVLAQTPEWIWHDNQGALPADNEVRFFRKPFIASGAVSKALLTVACDNHATVFLNGKQVLVNRAWERPSTATVTADLRPGENLLAIRGRNEGATAGLLAKLEITLANNQKQLVITDTSWASSATEQDGWQRLEFAATGWTKVISLGKLGVTPWGDVLKPPVATTAESLKLLPGFKAELIRSSEPGEGSWICMTVDPKGRLLISPQDDSQPLLRLTLSPAGQVAQIEPVPALIRQAMGLCFAHDSLYANAHGPKGTGLYRLIDANQNDQFDADEVTLLKNFKGEGEHGYHGVVLGPDGSIYVMNGNHTKVPDGLAPTSPHKNYQEDLLLPRQWDGNGHAAGILAPGGHILRTDAEGKVWELVLAGFRNAYDFDFNADGEIFTFDSDMEWDWGMPWYRPTRVNHCVSGGDYGWRSGTGKWPNYFPDSLPTTVDIGIGSPTGVKGGTKSNFPEKYKKALYVLDWSYGRIIAAHLTPKGATYGGSFETFVKGKPLNVADVEFGKDGAMYFITGGRGTQSGLYRVSHVGGTSPQSVSAADAANEKAGAEARALRRKLEAFHGKQDPKAVEFAWPHLDSPDRWIRYAARIAIESQPVEQWQSRALDEGQLNASLTALLALARRGESSLQTDLLQALSRLSIDQMSEAQMLEGLRVLSLTFIRMGRPAPDVADEVIRALDPMVPAKSERLNHELAQVLIYLGAPRVAERALALMDAAITQEDQIHYLFHLRTLKNGWTIDQRKKYFAWYNKGREGLAHPLELTKWFRDVERDYSDGASFPKFIANFRKEALENLAPAERTELVPLLAAQIPAAMPPGPPRTFVQDWKVEDILPLLDQVSNDRSFQKGKEAFAAAQCAACHRIGNEGGAVGPELSALTSKYTRRDILDSLLDPSKVVSDQYQNITVFLKNGDDVTGRLVDENDQKLVLITNALTGDQTEVRKADVVKREASKVSPMPEGLVSVLTKEEILDLLAFLESGGKATAPAAEGK